MKKIILSVAFLGLIGVINANAQSTTTEQPAASQQPAQQTPQQPQQPTQDPANTTTNPGTTTDAPAAGATTNDAAATAPATTGTTEEVKTPVKVDELPEGIKTTLKSDAVKEYTAVDASLVKAGGAEYYIINLKKGDDLRFVKLDKDGRPVKQ
jgi:cytoskeletal protein RodZ